MTFLSAALIGSLAHAHPVANDDSTSTELDTIYVTAEHQLQQSLGVSRISKEDIERRPVVNDIAELIRTMPGVNLSGNTATGQHGNKRQIDIRGMGPENTLILIDGKPVTSRQATRISMRGERNTRGDANWVPAEAIESINVLRGPAAARYGSGAMGGVVNITTRKIANEFQGSVNYHTNQPQDAAEGATHRVGFSISGPIVKDALSFRVYGNFNKTDADANNINAAVDGNGLAAGAEGVINQDIAGRLYWHINAAHNLTLDASFSRQGNIYNGDTQNSGNPSQGQTQKILDAGIKETSRVYRSAYSLTHNGTYEWGGSKSYISLERTTHSRFPDWLAGGPEGSYSGTGFVDSDLQTLRLSSEAYIPSGSHVLTAGIEYENSRHNDPHAMSQGFTDQGRSDVFAGLTAKRNSATQQHSWAIYLEDNWTLTPRTNLIPSLRFDYHSASGSNISGGLNFLHNINDNWTIKGGIARAYKAPNIHQTNPNFILYTRGNGCPINTARTVRCYYIGNPNLQAETAINKELGIEFRRNGYQASLNAFHSSYRNKITIGNTIIATSNIGNHLLQWSNTPRATISGLEGNLVLPLTDTLKWSNNFTYMHQSRDHQGNPLSLNPRHTLNSTLAWTPNERWDANLTFTHYGRIKPRNIAINRVEAGQGSGAPLAQSQGQVASYGIWGINAGYNWHNRIHVRAGINNLFNKQLYRSNNGAQTFNEHGRAFYGSVKLSF